MAPMVNGIVPVKTETYANTVTSCSPIFHSRFDPRRALDRPKGQRGIIMSKSYRHLAAVAAAAAFIAATSPATPASAANSFGWPVFPLFGYVPTDDGNTARADLRRTTVDYRSNEAPGTIIIDTQNTYLYFILPGGKAIRYGIGVGC